jgi:hypothetical protein
MKTLSKYQQVKRLLKIGANQFKERFPNDKPMIRQLINDEVDYYCKDLNLSEHQRNLLSDYACKLHPKN